MSRCSGLLVPCRRGLLRHGFRHSVHEPVNLSTLVYGYLALTFLVTAQIVHEALSVSCCRAEYEGYDY